MALHIVDEKYLIDKEIRRNKYGQKSFVLWFTGLSGSGKSTLAKEVEKRLFDQNKLVYSLDGDNIRKGLCNDLSFSSGARGENIRRIAEVSKLFVEAGLIVITSFISPFEEERKFARDILGEGEFVEVYVKASLEVCESRDRKGLYAKARAGVINNFTGINSPYEEPQNADIIIQTDKYDIEESVQQILDYLKLREYI